MDDFMNILFRRKLPVKYCSRFSINYKYEFLRWGHSHILENNDKWRKERNVVFWMIMFSKKYFFTITNIYIIHHRSQYLSYSNLNPLKDCLLTLMWLPLRYLKYGRMSEMSKLNNLRWINGFVASFNEQRR